MRASIFVFTLAALLAPVMAIPHVAREESSSSASGSASVTPTPTASEGASQTTSLTGAQATDVLANLTPAQESILIKNLLNGPLGSAAYPGAPANVSASGW
ncbi:unnamed protein product [Peniophora sp. CBMAI 1063]|nr:unnamed protein product [Peniophora sp. CBMAI 1063]